MKKLTITTLAFFLLMNLGMALSAETATAAERSYQPVYEFDGSFGFGSGPGNFDSGFGFNFGAGYTLNSIDNNLQARIDVSYYNFGQDFFGTNLDFTRVPVTISARYYFPINEQLRAFAQAGIETSFDSVESFTFFFGKQSKSEVNAGVSPGGGIEFFINPNVSIFALGRFHLISDSYFSMQFGGAVHF